MGRLMFAVRYQKIEGGTEVCGLTKSDRGSVYIKDSIVVLRGDLSPAEYEEALGQAAFKLINDHRGV